MKSTLRASVESFDRPSGNNFHDKKYDDNITIVRYIRHKEMVLNSNQYYARMIVDPNGGICDEKGLEKTGGLVTISKTFHAIHLPIASCKTCLVTVKDPKKCWEC